MIAMKPKIGEMIVEKMEPYDGDGFLCYEYNGGNCGFGPTKEAAIESWKRGEDIGQAAWNKWHGMVQC